MSVAAFGARKENVEPDPALARSYLKRAAEAGDDDADELLDMVNRIAVTP